MHNFSTLKECTSLAKLTSKNLSDSQGLPEARARAGVKITRNSSLSCYNYGPDVQPHRKNRCVGDLRLQHQGFPWQSGAGLRSLFRRPSALGDGCGFLSARSQLCVADERPAGGSPAVPAVLPADYVVNVLSISGRLTF